MDSEVRWAPARGRRNCPSRWSQARLVGNEIGRDLAPAHAARRELKLSLAIRAHYDTAHCVRGSSRRGTFRRSGRSLLLQHLHHFPPLLIIALVSPIFGGPLVCPVLDLAAGA